MKKPKKLKFPFEVIFPGAEWKPVIIDDKELPYIVSNEGVVVTLRFKEPRILNGYKMKSGYMIYCLKDDDKNDYWELGHRLVAKAFIPIPDELSEYSYDDLEVNHKEPGIENKCNNSVENLEWVTSSGNKLHAHIHGIYKDGEDHPEAKYTNSQINKVCFLLEKDKLSRMEISKKTGVDDATVGMILSGVQWKSISKYYDFSKRKKKHTLYNKETIEHAKELIADRKNNKMSFADIGRAVGMSRTSVWYLYNKYFKESDNM